MLAGLLVLASGCLGFQPPANPGFPYDGGDAVIQPQFDASTGAVHGFVFTMDIDPVAHALVALQPENSESNAAADGSFAFDFLEPGDYRLRAQADGFFERDREIQVLAGQVTLVYFLMRSTTPSGPRLDFVEETAKLDCFVALALEATDCAVPDVADHEPVVEVEVQQGLTALVVSARWTPTLSEDAADLTNAMRFEVLNAGNDVLADWVQQPDNTTRRLNFTNAGPEAAEPGIWRVRVTPAVLSPNDDLTRPQGIGGVVVDQNVEFYLTLAYEGLRLPIGYTGLPPPGTPDDDSAA